MHFQSPSEAIESFLLPKQPALVGFSGGADSTALLLALHLSGWPISAIHFDHQLRGVASRKDAAFCREFCRQHRIPFRCFRLDVTGKKLPGESVESAARRLRLEKWHELTAKRGQLVFLAHHADDAAEELFLRMLRGGSASGLTGLRECRTLADGTRLARPLLHCRKTDLIEFLTAQGVTRWCTDETNLLTECSRNKIRNELLPWWRKAFGNDDGIFATIEALREDAEFLEAAAACALPRDATIDQWRNLPPALFPRVIRLRYQLPLPPTRETIRRLQTELLKTHPGKNNLQIPLGAGKYATLHHKRGYV